MDELFEHQKQGIAFLKEKKKVILADEMGLGKTRQAIIAAQEDCEGMTGLKLIICPASLKINWQREIKMVVPDAFVQVIESGKEKQIQPIGWVVINYDMLQKYRSQLIGLKEAHWVVAGILDEAHYIKGKKTIRATTALEIVTGLDRVYCLTGTPVMNRPAEMFNLLRAISHPLGARKSFYSTRYCGGHIQIIPRRNGQILRFWDESGATRLPELRDLTKDSILRRTKDEVLDLPDKIISVENVKMTNEWKKVYDEAWENYISWVEAHPEGKNFENILNAQALVEIGKLKQVCSIAKIKRIAEDIESAIEQGEKVIVFSQFTNTIKQIAEEAKKIKIETGMKDGWGKNVMQPAGVVTLTGEDNMNARQESVDAFQNEDNVKVFVANIKAGGVGLNLTAATQVMFADMDWSPAIHDQATDRAHRIGQNKMVNVRYYVMENTIEEDIVEILQKKLQTIGQIVDGKAEAEDGTLAGEFLDRLKKRMGI